MRKTVVIGGGASGMTAAIAAAEKGSEVVLLEKNEKLGKKLFITGKGRCNLTNFCDEETFIKNVISNPYFLYSAIYTYGCKDVMAMVEGEGIKLKVERGNRVFPVSDKSYDIIDAFKKRLKSAKVKVVLNCNVKELKIKDGLIVSAVASKGEFKADSFIVATGGVSYPSTGSTGDGYKFAEKAGHTVTERFPSLVGLKADSFCKSLEGLSLKNVAITALVEGKTVYKDFGEMLFTGGGVSDPVILSASSYVTQHIGKDVQILIDFKPALTFEVLDKRVLRDFEEFKNKEFKNALFKLLPSAIIPVVIKAADISEDKQVNSVTKEERHRLVKTLKGFRLNITGTEGFERAVITKGGVNVKEIDPSTMASKLIPNLFFSGEVLDCDALTGGFNLQIAFSTGWIAGINS
ncbi:MAG: NAD(P)/FAD-dependent oxidoreductase [Clostridiales bacterium]|nr:NAD(P)/FAD-dependent oxidoreductase [Clostridiales bacterium]